MSPGIAIATAEIHAAQQRGAAIIGDIELFVREAQAPIIAITGSNGKSTVTTLVELMAKTAWACKPMLGVIWAIARWIY